VKPPLNTGSPSRDTVTASRRLRPSALSTRASATSRSPTATGARNRTSAAASTTVGWLTASMAA
jgi:hypothetical protein